jgi:inorganic pyrophosphatase
MTNLLKLSTWADEKHIYTVVETPQEACASWTSIQDFGSSRWPDPHGGSHYDWGLIPSTKAEDGDPLDVLVIHDAQTYPGVVLRCRPIGILEVEQKNKGKKERNDRVFAVPAAH